MKRPDKSVISLIESEKLSMEEKHFLLSCLEANSEELEAEMRKIYNDELITSLPSQEEDSAMVLDRIHQQIHAKRSRERNVRVFFYVGIAATLLIFLSLGTYFYKPAAEKSLTCSSRIEDILPGGEKATLTLGNGKKIAINTADTGVVVSKEGISIRKNKGGEIEYRQLAPSHTSSSEAVEYNTIATPRSGEYKVVLSDGTKVWLNSVSSIRFPAVFLGKERKVEITGEVYFEVAKSKEKPFVVLAGNQRVEVLGTQFNINSYSDEGVIKTTLIEGSVKIVKAKQTVMLKPGQQATAEKSISVQKLADAGSEVSWTTGQFYFKDSNIETVMRQAARWYDLEVQYEGSVPPKQLNGKISREVQLSRFLEMLGYSGIKFRMDGRKITIME